MCKGTSTTLTPSTAPSSRPPPPLALTAPRRGPPLPTPPAAPRLPLKPPRSWPIKLLESLSEPGYGFLGAGPEDGHALGAGPAAGGEALWRQQRAAGLAVRVPLPRSHHFLNILVVSRGRAAAVLGTATPVVQLCHRSLQAYLLRRWEQAAPNTLHYISQI